MQWFMPMSNRYMAGGGEPPNTCSVDFPSCLLVKLKHKVNTSQDISCVALSNLHALRKLWGLLGVKHRTAELRIECT